MGRIKNTINKIKFAKYCFSKGADNRFVKSVMEIGTIPELVIVKKPDNLNMDSMDKIKYHINMEESKSGFFADYNKLLEFLFFADYYNLVPVVQYSDKFCYAEKEPVNGRINPFEYYFQQPVMTIEEMLNSGSYIESRKDNIFLAKKLCQKQEGYTKSDDYLQAMGRIAGKYIKLQPDIKEKIEADIQTLKNYKDIKVLGVHVRGTDFKRNYNGHPIAITPERFLEEVKDVLKISSYDKVFLATDDMNAVELFKAELGDQVIYYNDVIRSTEDETVMKSVNERKNHHFLLGLEVLRDMYTLVDCDGLVAGLSQVSFAARIMKYSQNACYKELRIVDKGINYHRNRNCK